MTRKLHGGEEITDVGVQRSIFVTATVKCNRLGNIIVVCTDKNQKAHPLVIAAADN